MNEGDDQLLRRYRDIARDEPPPAIDAAVLAASRRAVASRPWSKRLAAPVSIAAVLMLAIGVTLEMQREQPGVEVAVTAPQLAVPSAVPDAATALRDAPTASAPQTPSTGDAFRDDARAEKPAPAKRAPPQMKALKKEFAPPAAQAPAAPAAPAPAEAPRPEPRAFSTAPPAPASIPAPPPPASLARSAESAASDAQPPARAAMQAPPSPEAGAKRALTAPTSAAVATAPPLERATGTLALPDPAAELERIARLRTEGRHEEADKALDEFQRKHPGYRIPDAMWDRVKRR
jgi:hypothetical protein